MEGREEEVWDKVNRGWGAIGSKGGTRDEVRLGERGAQGKWGVRGGREGGLGLRGEGELLGWRRRGERG